MLDYNNCTDRDSGKPSLYQSGVNARTILILGLGHSNIILTYFELPSISLQVFFSFLPKLPASRRIKSEIRGTMRE